MREAWRGKLGEACRKGKGLGRPGSCLPGLPQIRTCPIKAYGSSSHRFASRRSIRGHRGDRLRGSMPSVGFLTTEG